MNSYGVYLSGQIYLSHQGDISSTPLSKIPIRPDSPSNGGLQNRISVPSPISKASKNSLLEDDFIYDNTPKLCISPLKDRNSLPTAANDNSELLYSQDLDTDMTSSSIQRDIDTVLNMSLTPSSQVTSEKKVNGEELIGRDSRLVAQEMACNGIKSVSAGSSLFSTASGKQIHLSEDQLQRGRQALQQQ